MTFDWCVRGDHKGCKREYQRFLVDPKTNKVVYSDEVKRCECKTRGCKCYKPTKDRTKTRKTRRK